jgi:hypothetical protein
MAFSSRGLALVALATALLVAGGFALGGFLVGRGILESRLANRTVTVKGVAEQPVTADLATYPLRATVTDGDLGNGQRRLDEQVTAIIGFLQEYGFAPAEIARQQLEVQDVLAQPYRPNSFNNDARFILAQTVLIRSTNVELVGKLAQEVGSLVRRGIVLADAGGPSYSITADRFNQLKPDLIREATSAAKAAAAEFAKSSGSKVGGIRRANQGVIVILAHDDSPVVSERHSAAKRVRAVTTVDYFLTE